MKKIHEIIVIGLLVFAGLLMSGCTMKTVKIVISPDVDKYSECEILIDTTGSSLTTETDQTNTPDITPELSLDGIGEVLP